MLGGCGFLGSYVTESLIGAGHAVRVFDRLHVDTGNIDGCRRHVELFYGDMTNEVDLTDALDGVEYVFHFASTTIPQTATENKVFDVESNVVGILKLLEICRRKKIKRIVYSSSGGTVYGIPQRIPVSENHRTEPISAYGVSKLAIEKYFQLYRHLYGMDYVILRASNPYGPRQNLQNPQGAVVHFLASTLRGTPIEIWGDGSVVRDYFFVKDLLSLFPKLMSRQLRHSVFNVGAGRGYSLKQLLTAIEETLHVRPRVRFVRRRRLDVPINILSVKRIRDELQWKAVTNLESGIRETWQWLKTR